MSRLAAAEAAITVALLVGAVVACKPKPAPPAADVAAFIAQITTSPASVAPTTKSESAGVATYKYPDQAGGAVSNITLTTTKERPGAWRVSLLSAGGKLGWRSFSPDLGASPTDVDRNWLEVTEGPLKGAVFTIRDGGKLAEVYSPAFVLTKEMNGNEPMRGWACATGRAGIVGIKVDDFRDRCKEAVSKKVVNASFPMMVAGPLAAANCDLAWLSDVETRGTTRRFFCSYTAKTGAVAAELR